MLTSEQTRRLCSKKSKKNLNQSQKTLEHHCQRNQVKHLFVKVGGPIILRDTTQDRVIRRQLILPFLGLDVTKELRSVFQSCRQLRTQVESVTITSRQDALTTRMERLETCLSTVTHDQNNAAEATRECQTKMDQCLAQVHRLNEKTHSRPAP